MAPTLYYCDPSPPSRTVLLTAHAIGLELNKQVLNLVGGDHLTPEFLKINPQHTVPTLTDGDINLCDSHAIVTYLVNRYASDDSLYPKDAKQRALVDQRLYFDAVTLFPRLRAVCTPVIFHGKTTVDEKDKSAVYDSFSLLETFLKDTPWVAGNKMTIADLACVASVSSLVEVGFDLSNYPNLKKWLSCCEKQVPGYAQLNEPGAKQLKEIVTSRLEPNQF